MSLVSVWNKYPGRKGYNQYEGKDSEGVLLERRGV